VKVSYRTLPLVRALAIALVLLLPPALARAARTTPPAVAPSFTADQAHKGQTAYYVSCAECHGVQLEGQYGPALSGPNGNTQWYPVAYVYAYMTAQMPVGNADGLSQEQYLDIMAFLLQSHHHRPGTKPLTDSVASTSPTILGP